MEKCRYSSIQTLGTLDGPGVRFVLFLQGCPLHCGYCHNPETADINGGNEITLDEVMDQVIRCKSYFGKKGGITVSGGEPLLQARFVTRLFQRCHEEGINTCLDTSGCMYNADVERLLAVTDLCLLDIKMTNDEEYKNHIGCPIAALLKFLEILKAHGVDTWLRQVIVKGINDSEQSVGKFGRLANAYDNVKLAELLPFRKLCSSKYEELGKPFPFAQYPETDSELIKNLSRFIDKNVQP